MKCVSGYPEDFRRGVIESAVACYEGQVAASARGEVPLYRPRDWQAQERKRKKLIAKTAWHRPADILAGNRGAEPAMGSLIAFLRSACRQDRRLESGGAWRIDL